MKIITYPISNFYPENALDKSQLCFQIQSVSVNELSKLEHGIVILGLADDSGIKNVGGRIGAAEGPRKIREKLYRFSHPKSSIRIYDLGDLAPASSIEKTHQQATDLISKIHESNHFPFIFGGGHDLAYAEAKALIQSKQKINHHILNIDAHLDLRPTHPKITSGSPWYLLFEDKDLKKFSFRLKEFGIQVHCNAEALYKYAKLKKISIVELEEIQKKKKSASFLMKKILQKEKTSMVSIDIDSVASQFAPGCSAAQTLGFSAKDVLEFSFLAGQQASTKSFGIYETSPALDLGSQTIQLVAHCANQFLYGYETRAK